MDKKGISPQERERTTEDVKEGWNWASVKLIWGWLDTRGKVATQGVKGENNELGGCGACSVLS